MENELERNLLESIDRRHLEKSILMKTALALFHSDQVHRKELKSNTKLKALVWSQALWKMSSWKRSSFKELCVKERREEQKRWFKVALRSVHDKVADCKTAYEKRFGVQFDGTVIPLEPMSVAIQPLPKMSQYFNSYKNTC